MATTTTTTTTSQPPLRFLSFPLEIRIMIYRFALRAPAPLTPDSQCGLSPKLLQTCKQIHAEAVPILYGDNVFEIELTNTDGCDPSHPNYHPAWSLTRRGYGTVNIGNARELARHMRRLNIKVRHTNAHSLEPLRAAVRSLVEELGDLEMPPIRFLRLECHFDCDKEGASQSLVSPLGDTDRQECVRMLRMWLGSVRNVREVVLEGMPQEDADILREKLHAPADADEDWPEAWSLPARYEELEERACDIGFCEWDLQNALLAAERDDVEGFVERADAIKAKLLWHWEYFCTYEHLWR
ncbi:hypothetical protein B0T16DRAFT_457432 [Cercophora newfieldiana]|uniref:Uncharacterized protein n=1 Tax=Cercophora newfieldiana TaxID=92897 RepID=A0AA40CQC3_9PEZI|nr:hypothetical protein B0T16DRAFT_457432 [Cercophora newfieldiana]